MTYTHDDYTVGWIAALSDELTSAQALLDNEHDTLAAVQGDHNAYTLGDIGGHNIVIAGLPEGVIGTNAAGHAAANLFRSFPNIRFALMVGVGGGVPAAKIRLGDVVVSVPEGQTGGVIQYDLGTNLQEGGFTRKGFLRDPPSEVLTAVKKLRATARRKGYKLKTYHDKMLEENPLLRPDFERPKEDNLFEPDYIHTGAKANCSNCDTSKLVKREDHDTPVVHYGLIGSGNQVIRNATLRDQLHEDEGIICFEMEAAGLMRNFECLVIRGICDYCDTHKNKHWQPYAGAVAAAYAKELLLAIPAQQVKEMPKSRVLESIQEDVRQVREDIGKLAIHKEETRRSRELQEAIQWLAASDPETNYCSALELRESGSGLWLVKSEMYVQWKTDSIRHIWLHGKAGCGKSVIAATIIEDIRNHCENRGDIGCAMFYFTFSDSKKQSYRDCLYSLVVQLTARDPTSTMLIKAHQTSKISVASGSPNEESIEQILVSMVQPYSQFFLVLDALDESPDTLEGNHTIRQKLLRWLHTLSCRVPKLKILATSRHLNDIQGGMHVLGAKSVSMIINFINEDIKGYVRSQLSSDSRLSQLNLNIKKKIEDVFMDKADGMFRWAYCQMRELKTLQSTKPSHIERVLLNLPQTLDETYNRMIERIQPELRDDALVLLKWLTYPKRPMTLNELSETMIIDPYSGDGVVNIDDRGSPEDALELLSGLIVFIKPEKTEQGYDTGSDEDDIVNEEDIIQSGSYAKRSIRLAHFSVQEYLESTRILTSNIGDFHLQGTRENQFLSDCCINYLMNYASSDEVTKTEKDLDAFPLLGYAARFWYQHSQNTEELDWQIRLLRSKISIEYWIRVHDPEKIWKDPFKRSENPIESGLYYAAFMGLLPVAKVLIAGHSTSVNIQGGTYGNALQAACSEGHMEIVKLLLENQADVNAQGGEYGNALQAACSEGHESIVKLLLENQADVNAQGGRHGNALQAACYWGHESIVKLLLENQADVNTQGGTYGNALQAACYGRHIEIVKLLLENQADVNVQGGYYGNALQAACYRGHEDIVKLLLDSQADVNAQGGEYGNTLQAACYGRHESIVKLLLENQANVNAQGGYYGNVLQAACYRGYIEIVKLLLENQADVNAQGGALGNALQAACYWGHESIVKLLLENQADVNAQGGYYGNALQAACAEGDESIVKLLLENQADVNAQGGYSGNALQAARHFGHEGIAKLLIENQTDINAQDEDHDDALGAAVFERDSEGLLSS